MATILEKAREAIHQVLEGKVLLTRPVIAHEAQEAFDAVPLISDPQYEAGERLRADYWFAHLSPRVTLRWRSR